MFFVLTHKEPCLLMGIMGKEDQIKSMPAINS